LELTKSFALARVIYNGLVPFAVSMFEYFFSQVFRVLIAYDTHALEKRATHNLRVGFPTSRQVNNRVLTVGDIVAQAS
jgi:hypothetical protein